MGEWTVAVALGLVDLALWASLLPPPPAAAAKRLGRYCRVGRSPVGTAPNGLGPSSGPRGFGGRGPGLRALRRALPDALDTLAVCLRAGLGLHAAVAEYAKTASSVAGEVFRGYLGELAVGRPPDEALADLARRYPLDEVATAAAALAQGLRIGSPLADVFEAQAAHCRTLALHRAREAAQRLSTHLVLPLVAFIFPVVFIVGLGPVALKIARLVGLIR